MVGLRLMMVRIYKMKSGEIVRTQTGYFSYDRAFPKVYWRRYVGLSPGKKRCHGQKNMETAEGGKI